MKKYVLLSCVFFLSFQPGRTQDSYQPNVKARYHVSVYFGRLSDPQNILLDSAERVLKRRMEGAFIYTRLERSINEPEIGIYLAGEVLPQADSSEWQVLDRMCPVLYTEGRLSIYSTYRLNDDAMAEALPRLLNAKPQLAKMIRLSDKPNGAEIGYVGANDTYRVKKLLTQAQEEGLLPAGCRPVLSRKPFQPCELYFLKGPAVVSTHNILNAEAVFPEQKMENSPIEEPRGVPIRLRFDAEGTRALAELSAACAQDGHRALAVLYEDELRAVPLPAQQITDGVYTLTGGFKMSYAVQVARILRGGQLPGLPQMTMARSLK